MCIQQAHRATPIAGSKTRNSAKFHICGWVCLWGDSGAKMFLVLGGTNPPYMCAKYHWSTPHGLGDMLSKKLVNLTLELEARKLCKNHLFLEKKFSRA